MNRRMFLGSSLAASLSLLPVSGRAQDAPGRRLIVVGQTADLSGGMQNIGRDYFTGAKLAFDQANASDALGGRRIKFIGLDDGCDPGRAVANAKRLIDDERVDLLFGLTAESCVEAVANSAAFKDSSIEIFAPVSGVDHLAAKGRVTYLRPGSAEEMVEIVAKFSRLSLMRMAFVHAASPSMLAVRDAALAGLKARGLTLPRTYVLKESAGNAQALVSTMASDQTQAVVIMADSISAALLVKQLRPRLPTIFICLGSTVDVTSVQQLVGAQLANGLMVSRVVPDPANSLIPVVTSFQRALSKYMDEAPTSAGLEGYIAAQALLAVLRKAENPRQLLSAAQRRVGVFDAGGWKVNFANSRAVEKVEMAMLTRDGKLL
jgi:branched-chain amino acid transport system substrate-binding protein